MTLETIDLRRVGSALLVVLLHGLVLLVLLRTGIHIAEKPAPTREIVVRFIPSQAPAAARPETQAPSIRLISPPEEISPTPGEEAPPATNETGSLRGLYFYLYECTPENFANLTDAEKARCASASLSPLPDETNSLLNQPSRAKNAPHWQRALARKKAPPLLPCMRAAGFPVTPDVLYCLGKGAITGSFGDLDDAPGYGDAPPVEIHVPNNGDPQLEPAHH
ncbi:MAG TPA: hypothetical protein VKB71_12575 [Rhizomicrobium sp.]|nr:hypothetical protein [Rhizomicrobium sp.]